jgi:histidine triad (HIT) family protein
MPSSQAETIFSKIIRREIPAQIVFESDDVLGFKDITPQAPVHILFIPKLELATVNEASAEHALLLGKLVLAAASFAKAEGFSEQGYRLVLNCNGDGGQTVFHLHMHLLAGRKLAWPPG